MCASQLRNAKRPFGVTNAIPHWLVKAAKLLTKDEAQRIAADIAKLPCHRLKRAISTLA
jgi:hypothetical protein